MDEDLGCVAIEVRGAQLLGPATGMPAQVLPVSEAMRQRIDHAVRGIVMAGFERATQLLTDNRELLERGARALPEREARDEEAIRAWAVALRRD